MVSLEPEIIFSVFGAKITNTIIATIFVDAILIFLTFYIKRNISVIPGKIQNMAEALIAYFYDLTKQIAEKYTSVIFPWFASFFIFIFAANIMALLPGFGTLGFFHVIDGHKEFVPVLRGATSDFNTTLALATVSLGATHILAIKYNGIIGYIKKFVSFNPILLFVGILELVSEFTKLISLSFRLFGNIYAGEVVLVTISSLAAFIAPIPFLLLESIVALVQALVFAMLTMVFMSILIKPHHAEGGE